MNFVKFESATEKERIRNELRNAREELLEKAKRKAELRAEYEANKKMKGENDLHPSVNEKIEKLIKEHKKSSKSKKKRNKEEKRKTKKIKKDSKRKKKRKYSSSSSSSNSSTDSSSEEIIKKKKKKKRNFSTESSSSSSSSDGSDSETEEWIEKPSDSSEFCTKQTENLVRDNWMTEGQLLLKTFSNENSYEERKEKNRPKTYDPTKSSRELNPHWRDGGKGLPTFQRPKEDDDYRKFTYSSDNKKPPSSFSGNWRKDHKNENRTTTNYKSDNRNMKEDDKEKYEENIDNSRRHQQSNSREKGDDSRRYSPNKNRRDDRRDNHRGFLSDEQMNELGAKLIKAEIMGNDDLAAELKEKLEKAREERKTAKEQTKKNIQQPSSSKQTENKSKDEHILLTTTNSKGMTRPLSSHPLSHDPWGGRKANKKKQKAETHIDGERIRYFPDDDRYDIKQMFEREKYTTGHDSDAQFIEIAGKHKNPKDDLEDIFADKIRKNISDYDNAEKEKNRAIAEHERYTKILESCDKCFDSLKMDKSLMVSMGTTSYLSIPYHEGLQLYHCCIQPMQHITCSTQLDEDTWNEITEYRKSITRMFKSISKDVIFFEIANYLHKKPHMQIHCIANKNFEMAPMYFKKAIQESEYEWSTNKQLVTLKEKDLRRSIPKGLPYFWVHFGMDLGFAHVIEDQHKFKPNFAQEIIGGMLQLNPKAWRKPRKEHNTVEKVKQLAELWKPFDFTT